MKARPKAASRVKLTQAGTLGELIVRRRTQPGESPGTVVTDVHAPPPLIQILAYDAGGVEEVEEVSATEIRSWLGRRAVVWVNVMGLGDAQVISEIGRVIGIHQLALEDVVNVNQRPKVEEYEDQLFVVARMPRNDQHSETEQISLFVRTGLVVSFQEYEGDCFDPIRTRIRKRTGRMGERGADYLAYSILDAVTDSFFPMLEELGEQLEDVEDETLSAPVPGTVGKLHDIKRGLLHLRRAVWPLREVINALQREDVPVVTSGTRVYLRDCYDHVAQLIDLIENYREIVSGLLDVYLSSVSNRMNEVMKVLTIVATVFIPMTFIAGVYGMNFSHASSPWNMPELDWYLGYPLCLTLMAITGGGMLLFFRSKGWIGGSR